MEPLKGEGAHAAQPLVAASQQSNPTRTNFQCYTTSLVDPVAGLQSPRYSSFSYRPVAPGRMLHCFISMDTRLRMPDEAAPTLASREQLRSGTQDLWPSAERYHYLDAARSILMMLGVVLHTANIYRDHGHWLLRDQQCSVLFNYTVTFIASFRMPAFYIIAGFFCAFSIQRHGSAVFLRRRLLRIGLPLASAALVLNNAQLLFVLKFQEQFPANLIPLAGITAEWHSGGWVHHLWFLIYLLAYLIGGAVLYRPLSGVANYLRNARLLRFAPLLLTLPIISFLPNVALRVLPAAQHSVLGFFSLPVCLRYLPLFAFGYFAFLLKRSLSGSWQTAVSSGVLVSVGTVGLGFGLLSSNRIAELYSTYALNWGLSLLALQVFRLLCDRESALFRYMADASYSVYLFHHVIVVVLGVFVLPLTWLGAGGKFLVVLCAAIASSLAIHHFCVLKIRALRFLFNGK